MNKKVMKILLISNGVFEYDGRLRELINISKLIGDTTYITRVDSLDDKQEDNHLITMGDGMIKYFGFVIKCIMVAIKIKKIDILFVDNRKPIIPALIIIFLKRPTFLIQDVRELYLINEVNSITSKMGCYFEKILIKKADILLCANKYRAQIMQKHYLLNKLPLVFENIRALEYSGKYTSHILENKFLNYFTRNTYKIISTSGCDVSRTTDKLVNAVAKLENEFDLFLVGSSSKKDELYIKKLIEEKGIKNVQIIGKLNSDELKYFISKCQIGIVNYSKKDTNNIYCASGKIYEFIFEGIPIVTTENLPLVELVESNKIGKCDDNYCNGILEVYNNYGYFQDCVLEFSKNLNVSVKNINIARSVIDILSQVDK